MKAQNLLKGYCHPAQFLILSFVLNTLYSLLFQRDQISDDLEGVPTGWAIGSLLLFSVISAIFGLFITNWLCKKKYTNVAWIFVLYPWVLSALRHFKVLNF